MHTLAGLAAGAPPTWGSALGLATTVLHSDRPAALDHGVLLGQVTDLLDLNRAAEVALQIEATLTVMAEPQRLRQVLVKLLSNAIKYKRRGGTVQLGVSALNASTARLVVQDNRIGMTTEQQQRLFQPFEHLGVERTSTPGTGLGLVIARSLINEMGGQLALTSAPGVGTTVTLTLPLAPAS